MAAQFTAHQRFVLARARLVNRTRNEFLAGAGFTEDQHGGVGRGDALERLRNSSFIAALAPSMSPMPAMSRTLSRRYSASCVSSAIRRSAASRSSTLRRMSV